MGHTNSFFEYYLERIVCELGRSSSLCSPNGNYVIYSEASYLKYKWRTSRETSATNSLMRKSNFYSPEGGIHDRLFTGSRNSARDGWKFIIEEMGLQGRLSPQQAGTEVGKLKKKKTYKELKAPQSGVSTEGGEETAATWKWFSAMHEAIGSKPSIQPSVLIASCSTENPSAAEREHPGSSPEHSGSSAEQQGPLSEDRGTLRQERRPKKRKSNDPILQFLMEEAEYAGPSPRGGIRGLCPPR